MTTAMGDRAATVEPVLIDIKGVAAALGCSTRHVARLRDAGQIPAPIKLGVLVRWDRAKFREWIAAGCPAVRPQS